VLRPFFTRTLAPVGPQVLYLPVYLVQRLPYASFQLCATVVGEIAGEHPRLFQEHAHVAQLRELGFSHTLGFYHANVPSLIRPRNAYPGVVATYLAYPLDAHSPGGVSPDYEVRV
jgi:hypothetical protein